MDTRTLKVIKIYEAEKAVNAAAISPLMPHVRSSLACSRSQLDVLTCDAQIILGGGQDAAEVTTTHSRTGNFQTRFFNLITQTELASVKGHFGPIHTLSFSPDGKSFASGSEDGYVRIHHFDPSYYTLGVDEAPAGAPAGKAPKKDA